MADSIFDLYDNLNQPSPSGFNSYQDLLARQRAQLEQTSPTVAAQMPTLGAATPGQRIYQAQQQAPVDQLATGVQQLTDAFAQSQTPPDAKPKDIQKTQQMAIDTGRELLNQINPMIPKKTYGPDIGSAIGMPANSGGILGLGIQPIDLLAFAVGAGLTSRMPQDQAMAWTMKIAGMPSAFRNNQEAAAMKWINENVNMGQLQNQTTHMGLLQQQNDDMQRKLNFQRIAALLADNGIKNIPPSILAGAGVPMQTILKLQEGHYSVQNTPNGLMAVSTSDPTDVKPILDSEGKPLMRQGPANAYTDLRQYLTNPKEQGGAGLTPGTAAFQNEAEARQARAAGEKAGAQAKATEPYRIEIIQKGAEARGAEQRKTIDYRLGAMANAPISEKTASLWVDSAGNAIPVRDIIGKTPAQIDEAYGGVVRLESPAARGAITTAKSLPDMQDKIAALLPSLFPKYKGQALSDIFSVQGNKLVLKSKELAGDPKLADFTARMNDFIIEVPIGMGLPGGRESDKVREQTAKGLLSYSVEGILAGMKADIDSVASKWRSRGIDITAGSRGPAGGGAGQAPALSKDGELFLQELKKAMGK